MSVTAWTNNRLRTGWSFFTSTVWSRKAGATLPDIQDAYLRDFIHVGAVGRYVVVPSGARYVLVETRGRFLNAKQLDRGSSS